MQDYQSEFIEFAIKKEILRFGEFILKSGRVSPYFFNSGLFNTGASLARLGGFYARAIIASGIAFDVLFGPAYKGIPLVAATAIALMEHHGMDTEYAFNRKEAKDHGEGGDVVGASLGKKRVLIVDDVISAGTSIKESIAVIHTAEAIPTGVAISLDRQERGQGARSAVQDVEARYGIPVVSVTRLDHLIQHLEEKPEMEQYLNKIQAYREKYGVDR